MFAVSGIPSTISSSRLPSSSGTSAMHLANGNLVPANPNQVYSPVSSTAVNDRLLITRTATAAVSSSGSGYDSDRIYSKSSFYSPAAGPPLGDSPAGRSNGGGTNPMSSVYASPISAVLQHSVDRARSMTPPSAVSIDRGGSISEQSSSSSFAVQQSRMQAISGGGRAVQSERLGVVTSDFSPVHRPRDTSGLHSIRPSSAGTGHYDNGSNLRTSSFRPVAATPRLPQ